MIYQVLIRPRVCSKPQRRHQSGLLNHLNTILIIYYTQVELPVENTEFIIMLMFSILKNSRLRDRELYAVDIFEIEILKKLVNLVLSQKLC